MKKKPTKLFNQVKEDDAFDALDKNYQDIAYQWFSLQLQWMSHSYKIFQDSEKYLILIYLFHKTLESYSKYLIKLNIKDYFNKDRIEIEKFNIKDIAKQLNIPKESARRKVIELEKSKIILRLKKKLIIDRSAFRYQRPIKSIEKISSFLSIFSEILLKEKILKKKISAETIDNYTRQNFTNCLNFFYEMYIPSLVLWKNYFGDLNTFHIFNLCVMNNTLAAQKKDSNNLNIKNRMIYFDFIIEPKKTGINAMSISKISGIPRATVIRKLQLLVKKKIITIDDKKLYTINKNKVIVDLIKVQKEITKKMSNYATKVFNAMMV